MNILKNTFIYFLLISILNSACSNVKVENQLNVKNLKLNFVDSNSISNNETNFLVYKLNTTKSGELLGYNYPLLDLSLIRDNGEITQISQAGEGPGELNGLLNAVITENNEIIALTETNNSKIILFDSTLTYKNEIKLIGELTDYFPATFKSYLYVEKNDLGQYEVYFSLESLKHSEFENNGFYEGYGLAKIVIDQNFEKVLDKSLHLNYAEIPFYQKALKTDKKNWKYNSPHLSIKNGRVFVLYDSNPILYEYDMDFNLIKEYPLTLEFPSYDYSIQFVDILDTEKRLLEQEKLYFGNYTFLQMHQSNDQVFLTYSRPINPEQVNDKNFDKIENKSVIHKINIKNGSQSSSVLPERLTGFEFVPKNDSVLFITGTINGIQEDSYLYTIELQEKN